MAPIDIASKVRPPAVAGMFYPLNSQELRTMLQKFLDGDSPQSDADFKAFVLPHAGYLYSGSVAAIGYRAIKPRYSSIKRIILLGPSHRMAFSGAAFCSYDALATPLGEVMVDQKALDSIRDLPQVAELDSAHEREHSLEVHLPFLQMALSDFKVVPLIVGSITESELAEVLNPLWGGDETCFIVSSDLSHYHDYTMAKSLDEKTARLIASLTPVTPDLACGAVSINGLLHVVRTQGLKAQVLGLRNSGDTAGPRTRVVGYGAFAFK